MTVRTRGSKGVTPASNVAQPVFCLLTVADPEDGGRTCRNLLPCGRHAHVLAGVMGSEYIVQRHTVSFGEHGHDFELHVSQRRLDTAGKGRIRLDEAPHRSPTGYVVACVHGCPRPRCGRYYGSGGGYIGRSGRMYQVEIHAAVVRCEPVARATMPREYPLVAVTGKSPSLFLSLYPYFSSPFGRSRASAPPTIAKQLPPCQAIPPGCYAKPFQCGILFFLPEFLSS